MKIPSATILLMLLSFSVFAQQSDNIRLEKRLGVGVQVGGPTLIASAEIDLFITRNINLEAGIGLIGFYGGAKWCFGVRNKPMHWAAYMGACYMAIPDDILGGKLTGGGYLPIGAQFIGERGFTFSAEVAGLFHETAQTPIFGALKTGFHF